MEDRERIPLEAPERDWLALAERHWHSVGSFNGNEDTALCGVLAALVGVGYELRRLNDALGEPREPASPSRRRRWWRGSPSA